MKIHYKGMTIVQAMVDPMWGASRIGYGVLGVCLPELRSIKDAKEMVDNYLAGKINLNQDSDGAVS